MKILYNDIMPIDEAYKKKDLEKLLNLKANLEPTIEDILQDIDEDDLEFGYKEDIDLDQNIWKEAVEDNNYYDIKTETLEHHDGIYLKATFINEIDNIKAERYVNIRSNARIEISYRCFITKDNVLGILEKIKDKFSLTLKSG